MKVIMKNKLLFTTFILLSVALPAFADTQVVKIGSAAPKTGEIGYLGQDLENGAQLAVNEINAKGDLTINGRKIVLQLVGMDDKGVTKDGLLAAQKLIDANVVAVVGHLNSGISMPANALYSANSMVQVSPASTNPKYTLESIKTPDGYNSAYRLVAIDHKPGIAVAQFLLTSKKAPRVAIMHDFTQYGKELSDTVKQYLIEHGGSIIDEVSATDKTTDFTYALEEFRELDPDYIFWGGIDDTAANLTKQMKQMGLRAVLVTGDGACWEKFVELAGSASDGLICSSSGIPLSSLNSTFSKKYEKTFPKQRVNLYAPFAYDAVYSIVQAMKIANATDRSAISSAMPKVDLKGLTGRIRFDKNGDRVNSPITVWTVYKNTFVPKRVMRF